MISTFVSPNPDLILNVLLLSVIFIWIFFQVGGTQCPSPGSVRCAVLGSWCQRAMEELEVVEEKEEVEEEVEGRLSNPNSR